MVVSLPSLLKSKQTLTGFSMKGHHYYPHPNTMKIKAMIQSHFLRHVCQVVQAFNKAKSMFMELLHNKSNKVEMKYYLDTIKMKKRKKSKKVFSSIRLHYNWCSSHVLPMPEEVLPVSEGGGDGFTSGMGPMGHVYYDSTWMSTTSIVPADDYCLQDGLDAQLSGYLHWLDEKVPENVVNPSNTTASSNGTDGAAADIDEIDRLADKFIARFHEKFRLEKQESYRRYQEMLARSV